MKIISKYKDYYDYYQGIFGIDEKRVYQRKDIIKSSELSDLDKKRGGVTHVFAINHKLHFIIQDENGFRRVKKAEIFNTGYFWKQIIDYSKGVDIFTDINKRTRKPIVKVNSYNYPINFQTGDPLMKSFGFHKVMDAKTLYIEVETCLGWFIDNPVKPDKRTDKQKITDHGFDLKQSFRHRK